MITLSLNKPVSSIEVENGLSHTDEAVTAQIEAFKEQKTQEFEDKKQELNQLIAALGQAAVELKNDKANTVANNQDQIGLLAVEIAARILSKAIDERQYDIKGIIAKMLEAAPTIENATVKLNPEDYASLQKAEKSGIDAVMDNIKFEADWSIRPAECVLETPKGILEYLIEDQLQRLSEVFEGH